MSRDKQRSGQQERNGQQEPGEPQAHRTSAQPGNGVQEPPARAAAYIPPTAAPKETRYHTIDMKAVRLSPDIDPRRMKTQLSLRAVNAVATARRPSRVSTWLVLLLAGGALGTSAWWFSRWHHQQALQVARDPEEDGVVFERAGVSPLAPAAAVVSSTARLAQTTSVDAPVVGFTSEASSATARTTEPVAASAAVQPPEASSSLAVHSGYKATITPKSTAPSTPAGSNTRPAPKVTPKPRSVTRKSNQGAEPPPGDRPNDAPSQPKLWLE